MDNVAYIAVAAPGAGAYRVVRKEIVSEHQTVITEVARYETMGRAEVVAYTLDMSACWEVAR